MNKFGISLYFDEKEKDLLVIYGMRFFEVDKYSTRYETIQFLKNNVIKKEIPLSLLDKLDLGTLMFGETPLIFDKNDKIGIKLL